MSPRPSAPTFPPQDESALERPSHADASHVMRRRASSAPAHEVDPDEVELVDVEPPPLPSPSPFPPAPQPSVATTQATPLPLPPRPSRPVFQVPLAPEAVRRARGLLAPLAGVLAAAATGTIVSFLWPPSAPRREAPVTAPLAATPAAPTITAARSANDVPVVDVAKLPRAKEGLVIGSEGHRLWIDGALAPSWQAPVACGAHVVQVGSAGVPRAVTVPCGANVTVSP